MRRGDGGAGGDGRSGTARDPLLLALGLLGVLLAGLYLLGDLTPLGSAALVVPALMALPAVVVLLAGAAGIAAAVRRLQAPPPTVQLTLPPLLPPTQLEAPYSPPRFPTA